MNYADTFDWRENFGLYSEWNEVFYWVLSNGTIWPNLHFKRITICFVKKKKRPWISGSKCRIKQLFQETTAIVQARGSEKGDSSRGGEKCGTLNTFWRVNRISCYVVCKVWTSQGWPQDFWLQQAIGGIEMYQLRWGKLWMKHIWGKIS